MSSVQPLPQIWECPDGKILTCQFQFSTNYTPILTFTFISVGIFAIPWLLRMLNNLIFEGRRSKVQNAMKVGPSIHGHESGAADGRHPDEQEETTSKRCFCCKKKSKREDSSGRVVHPTSNSKILHGGGFQPLSKWNQANLETPHQSLEEEDLEEERDGREQQKPHRQFVRGLKKKALE